MPKILQWLDIQESFKGAALLLGNGASIAVHDGFSYSSLRVAAEKHGYLTPEVAAIFRSFATDDFELVLRRLWEATLVNKALEVEPGKVEAAYRQVRQALIATVREVHIPYDDAKQHLEPMFQFMKSFDSVFCLNYDLLVYWAMMASRAELKNWFKDCFQSGGFFREDWETCREPYHADGATLVFYPHGSLITARRADITEGKLRLKPGGNGNLLERILDLWETGDAVPLFVSEGTSDHKRKAIASSNYLTRVFREALPTTGDALVIYGWAASEQDNHILAQLLRSGTPLRRVAVSVYGSCQISAQKMEEALKTAGVTEIFFYDAESPGCWIYRQEGANS